MNKYVLLVTLLFGIGATIPSFAQEREVSGTVYNQDQEPLPGVNIVVKSTTQGTTTNASGEYTIQVPGPDAVLVYSFVGMVPREKMVGDKGVINVTLKPSEVGLDEVVVVGYGKVKKSDLTGSVSSVKAEEIENTSLTSIDQGLQGRIPGMVVTQTTGQPGAATTIRIRGTTSLTGRNEPLYVIDGVPVLSDASKNRTGAVKGPAVNPLASINPADIESVEVLKDASATAIYGARGANGVVLITTKQGEKNSDQFSFDAYYGIQQISRKIPMLNARQLAELGNEAADNAGVDRRSIYASPANLGEGTNWQDLLINDSAPIQKYNISASGGGEQMSYNISANYYDETGVFRDADFRRVTFRANNEYYLSDNVTFGHNLSLMHNERKNEPGDIVNVALRADPTVPPLNDEGYFSNTTVNGGSINPLAAVHYNRNDNFKFRSTGDAYVEVDFLDNFTFESSLGLDWSRDERKTFNPEYYISSIQNVQNSNLSVTEERQVNWLNENTLSYNADFGRHSVDAVTGVTFQEYVFESLGGSRQNFPGDDPTFYYLDAGDSDSQTNFNASNSWGMISYLARVNYQYDNRYLLTLTFRRDGSSKFGENNRWSNFPSAAVGWRLSNEDFMSDMDWLSNLKLRTSYGIIGNDKIPSGEAIPTVNSGLVSVFGPDQSLHPAATVTALANPNMKWEETEQFDVGLEFSLLKGRLSGNVDWYQRNTNDILVRVPVPDMVGVISPPIVNAAEVKNQGVDFDLNWSESRGDLQYQIGFNGSTVTNEVQSLGDRDEAILGGDIRNVGFATRTEEGHPIGAFYGWKQEGIFQNQEEIDNSPTRGGEQPGDIKIADTDGDGDIDQDDKTYLGSPIPDLNLGINMSANYRQFDMSLSFDGQLGGQVVYARQASRGFRQLNYESLYLDRWHGPGTSNEEPRVTESGHNYQVLDRFMYDSDFFRLRNVQLGYTLPMDLTSRLSIQNVRIFANATNLFRIDDYPGYTPQVGSGNVLNSSIDYGTYPVPSSYVVGVELDF